MFPFLLPYLGTYSFKHPGADMDMAHMHTDCKGGMYGFVNQNNQSAISRYANTAASLHIHITLNGDAFSGVMTANPNSSVTASATSPFDSDGGSSAASTATGSYASSSGDAEGTVTSASPSANDSETDTSNSGANAMSISASSIFFMLASVLLVVMTA